MTVAATQLNRATAAQGLEATQHNASLPPWHALAQRLEHVRQLPQFNSEASGVHVRSVDPTLKGDRAEYKRLEGELYAKGGPKLRDVDQGGLGDCYFLAAVGSIVADDPQRIKDSIRSNADGTYSFRFYKDDGKAVWITVDADLPVDAKGDFVYAQGKDADGDGKLELWVPLMEKAYAKFEDKYGAKDKLDGYEDIGAGGSPAHAMEVLTGKSSWGRSVSKLGSNLDDALSAANSGADVVASTSKSSDGWVGNHAYTVVGTYEEDGVLMVKLRNPWGSTEPDAAEHGKNENDGLFSVTLDEFKKHVSRVSSDEPQNTSPIAWLFDWLRPAINAL